MSHIPSLSVNNGTGTALLFFRHVEPAWKDAAAPVFEATVWFTALYLPLIPLSTWVVRPIGIRRIQTGLNKFLTTYEVDFMERLPMKPLAVIWMYMKVVFHLAVMIAPAAFSVLAWVFDASPGWRSIRFLIPWMVVVSFLWLWVYPLFLLLRKDRYFPPSRLS